MSQAWDGFPVSLGNVCINVMGGVAVKLVCDIMMVAEFVSSGKCPSGKQLVIDCACTSRSHSTGCTKELDC